MGQCYWRVKRTSHRQVSPTCLPKFLPQMHIHIVPFQCIKQQVAIEHLVPRSLKRWYHPATEDCDRSDNVPDMICPFKNFGQINPFICPYSSDAKLSLPSTQGYHSFIQFIYWALLRMRSLARWHSRIQRQMRHCPWAQEACSVVISKHIITN